MTVMNPEPRRRRPDGPHPGILAIVSLVLTIAAVLAAVLLANGQLPVSPVNPTSEVFRYYTDHVGAAEVGGFLLFGSAVPLGIFAATIYARLLKLGIRVPGPGIAFYGGISASLFVGLAGLLTWVLGQPITGQSGAAVHTLVYAIYAFGGVGFVVGVGLLIAGIAVPTLILRLAPRWLAWAGLVIAAISELSFLSLLVPEVSVALPIGRFLGLLWLAIIGFMLPHNRQRAEPSAG